MQTLYNFAVGERAKERGLPCTGDRVRGAKPRKSARGRAEGRVSMRRSARTQTSSRQQAGCSRGARSGATPRPDVVGAGEATAKRAWRAEGRDSMRRSARKRAAALRRRAQRVARSGATPSPVWLGRARRRRSARGRRRGATACAALPANEQPPTGGVLPRRAQRRHATPRLVGAGEATAKRAWRAEGRESMRRSARKRAAALRRVLPRRARRRFARPRCGWGGRGGGEARPVGEARRSFARHAQVSERLPSGAAGLPSRAAGARNVRAHRQRVCRRNQAARPDIDVARHAPRPQTHRIPVPHGRPVLCVCGPP